LAPAKVKGVEVEYALTTVTEGRQQRLEVGLEGEEEAGLEAKTASEEGLAEEDTVGVVGEEVSILHLC